MPTNQLLPFATSGGANVLPYDSYQALVSRLTGYASGVAQSPQLNTTWRQAAFAAAMIGQFTVDNAGQDVLDDGDVATFEANFAAAVSFVAKKNGLIYVTAGGSGNALTITVPAGFTSLPQLVGVPILVRFSASNTGAATVNANGLGAVAISRADGTALQAMDQVAGRIGVLVYDGAGFHNLTTNAYAIQSGSTNYAIDTGPANALTVALTPAPAAYAAGLVVRAKVAATNTGAATLNVNGLGVKSIKRGDGPLLPGDLVAGAVVCLVYDGNSFQVENINNGNVAPLYFAADTGTANALVASIPGYGSAYVTGQVFWVLKGASANTSTTPNVNLNGIGAKTIVRRDGAALAVGDLPGGTMLPMSYDGSNMRVLVASTSPILRTVAFTTPGAFSLTVPANVYRMRLKLFGGGGGGGLGQGSGAGSGGGGGGYAEAVVDTTPGATIIGVVGAGGGPGSAVANGQNGSASTVTYNGVTYSAGGGDGGQSVNAASTGGSTSGGINSISSGTLDVDVRGEPSAPALAINSIFMPGKGGSCSSGGFGSWGRVGVVNSGFAPGGGGPGSAASNIPGSGARGEVRFEY